MRSSETHIHIKKRSALSLPKRSQHKTSNELYEDVEYEAIIAVKKANDRSVILAYREDAADTLCTEERANTTTKSMNANADVRL